MKSLRTLLLASTPMLAIAAPAMAADVTGTRTTPVLTSTANNGAADNVVIVSDGIIELPDGTAVTIDSNNSVTNRGSIVINDANNATGIRVLGGFTGTVDNFGRITIDEDYARTDTDNDGTLDGDLAQGSGRTGILIEGPAFAGNVANRPGSTISIEGNNSAGIDIRGDLTGGASLIQGGTVGIVGDNSVGVAVRGAVSGDVVQRGAISALGENSSALVVAGNVTGGVNNGGSLQSTGFQYFGTSNYFDPDETPEGFEPPPFDGDDLLNNGATLVIAGTVRDPVTGRGGFLNDGPVGGGTADDPSTGTDPTKDIKGDFDVNRGAGTISSIGSAPAVLISPDLSSANTGDVVIGLVVERVRDTLDDDKDGDVDEVLATFNEDYGFVNRGTITANGLNVGFSANTIVITGSQDGTRDTIVEQGILNSGGMSASASEANSTLLRLGAGAQVPRIDNTGAMSANVATETNHNVTVMLIEAGSFMAALNNSGTISATARGDQANVVAIRDLSGTLVTIDNSGIIAASFGLDNDDDDGDGRVNDFDEVTGDQIAMDLRTHAAGQNVTIRQTQPAPVSDTDEDGDIDADDAVDPGIAGSVLLGAGDDTIQLNAGRIVGDVSFGAGADTLSIDGGADYTGRLSDDDGQLAVSVANGGMNLSETTQVTVTSLNLGDQSTSSYGIDLRPGSAQNAQIVADAITIGAGAQITPRFVGIGATDPTSIEILRADTLTLAGGHSIASNLSLETPFLFDAGLSTTTDGTTESVVVTVRRKTPEELGMSANQAAAYEPAVLALNADEQLLVEVVNLDSSEEFYAAYNQLMPEFSLSALQFAVSNMDGGIGAVGNRLDAVRGGRDGAGAAWVQEFGLFLDRESSFDDPGYRGNGFGMALGVDRPLGPFYAVGLNVVGSSSEIEQPQGFDSPLSVASAQIGAYAAANAGNLLLDLYAGAGADFFDSERRVIVGDVTRLSTSEWKAHHATASARLAYDIQMSRLFARPAVSVDYFRMDEESYSEAGGGAAVDLRLAERSNELLATTASLTVGAQFGYTDRTWWSPRMRVGYRHEKLGTPSFTTAQFLAGGDPFMLTADDLPESGGIVGFTFAAGSRWSSFALDYDADVREGFVRHGLRVAFRFIF